MESQFTNFLLAAITMLLGVAGYLLKRMFDRMDKLIDRIDDIGLDVSDMKPKLEILWKDHVAPASSPRQLNERGQRILAESGIKEIVDARTPELLAAVKEKDVSNPYDAERAVLEVVDSLPDKDPDLALRIKTGAFNAGEDMVSVLYVGGLYLRNKIFPQLGFQIEVPDADGEDMPAAPEANQPDAAEPTDPANP